MSGIKRKILNSTATCLKALLRLTGERNSTKILAQLSEKLIPIIPIQTPKGLLKFFSPGILPEWRAQTFLTKDTEIIEWLESFRKDAVFWDVGANIGTYTLYAALNGAKVYAFEPSANNYYLMARNIEINKMDDRISALCLAFDDKTNLDSFYMGNTELGGAFNSFGVALDWEGKDFQPSFKQAMLGFSIDDFIQRFNPLFPSYIKIDVDGIEDKILAGMQKTLKDRRLLSMNIELNTQHPSYAKLKKIIEDAGLTLTTKSHSKELDNGPYAGVYNHLFVRNT